MEAKFEFTTPQFAVRGSMVFTLYSHLSLDSSLKHKLLGSVCRISDSGCLWWGLSISRCNRFPGDADLTAGGPHFGNQHHR